METKPIVYWDRRARKYGTRSCGYLDDDYFRWNESVRKNVVFGLVHVKPNMTVLDVGCGVGNWCIEFARRGGDVTGIDFSKVMMRMARARVTEAGAAVNLMVQNVESLSFVDESFDLVVSITVLQHIIDERKFLEAVKGLIRVTRKGGTIIVLEYAPDSSPRNMPPPYIAPRDRQTYVRSFCDQGAVLQREMGVGVLGRTLVGGYERFCGIMCRILSENSQGTVRRRVRCVGSERNKGIFEIGRKMLLALARPLDVVFACLTWRLPMAQTRAMAFRRA